MNGQAGRDQHAADDERRPAAAPVRPAPGDRHQREVGSQPDPNTRPMPSDERSEPVGEVERQQRLDQGQHGGHAGPARRRRPGPGHPPQPAQVGVSRAAVAGAAARVSGTRSVGISGERRQDRGEREGRVGPTARSAPARSAGRAGRRPAGRLGQPHAEAELVTGYTSVIAARPAVHTRPAASPCTRRARASSAAPVARANAEGGHRQGRAASDHHRAAAEPLHEPSGPSAASSWPTGNAAKISAATAPRSRSGRRTPAAPARPS